MLENNLIKISIVISLISIAYAYRYYFNNIEYYSQIVKYSKIPDYTRWILSDKYIAKEYAKINGFKVAETYQIVRYPHQIKDFSKSINNFVIKPTDLCDSRCVYLINNLYDIKNKKYYNLDNIKKELQETRSKIGNEYYMHDGMYKGLVPYSGYIVEELLLDEGDIPSDYKCYVFGGKIHYIAVTYDREVIKNKQTFKSVWMNRDWQPVVLSMIKKGYNYKNLPKPHGYDKLIKVVENMGKILKRHCRIDVYLIDGEVYLGEYTFFCGAFLHTLYCNYKLGKIWLKNKDNYKYQDNRLLELLPNFYNRP